MQRTRFLVGGGGRGGYVHGRSVSLVLLGIPVMRKARRAAVEQRSRGQWMLQGCGAVRRTSIHTGTDAAGAVNGAFGVAAGVGLPSTGAHRQKHLRCRTTPRCRWPPPAAHTNQAGLVHDEVAPAVVVADHSAPGKRNSFDHRTSRALPNQTCRSSGAHYDREKVMIRP